MFIHILHFKFQKKFITGYQLLTKYFNLIHKIGTQIDNTVSNFKRLIEKILIKIIYKQYYLSFVVRI